MLFGAYSGHCSEEPTGIERSAAAIVMDRQSMNSSNHATRRRRPGCTIPFGKIHGDAARSREAPSGIKCHT